MQLFVNKQCLRRFLLHYLAVRKCQISDRRQTDADDIIKRMKAARTSKANLLSRQSAKIARWRSIFSFQSIDTQVAGIILSTQSFLYRNVFLCNFSGDVHTSTCGNGLQANLVDYVYWVVTLIRTGLPTILAYCQTK